MIAVHDLKTDGRNEALGIDNRNPEFSWLLRAEGRNRRQSAYQVLVALSPETLRLNRGDAWDTGMQRSARSSGIGYQGSPLQSRTRYWWKVQVWDEHGQPSGYSAATTFETSFLDSGEWKAHWIGGESLLRKEFHLHGDVRKARAYVTGLAYYELYLNGQRVGNQLLSPSFTAYEERIEYQTYEVTEYLRPGANAAGIFLGGHWPRGYTVANVTDAAYYHGELKALLQLEFETTDGSLTRILTDGTWRCARGPVLESSIYGGETYDARLEEPGWARAGFDDSAWRAANVCAPSKAVLFSQGVPPIAVVGEVVPKSVRVLTPHLSIVDLGQEVSGWVSISVRGERGRKVVVRYAELLYGDGTINQENLRGAASTDTYVLKGDGRETYAPRFTYHGFRYAQIERDEGVEIDEGALRGQLVRSGVRETGHFECSQGLLNQIHNAMRWTITNGMHGIPAEDAARDERQGWLADAVSCVEASIYGFDMLQFYRKWLADIRDVQNRHTGNVEYLTAPPFVRGESFEWTVAYFLLVHFLFRYYDDLTSVKTYYPHLKHYCSYLKTREENNLLQMPGLGDWLGMQPTRSDLIVGPLYCRAMQIMSELASAIGRSEEAAEFSRKAAAVRDSYNAKHYDQHRSMCHLDHDSGYYGSLASISQLANALPLLFDMPSAEYRDNVIEKLVWQLTEARGTPQLTTGVIGTKYLVDALAKLGRNDITYALFRRSDYPSWGFMMAKGATTIWERWEYMIHNEMNLHSLITLASPDVWFYRDLAGIQCAGFDDEHRRMFAIRPFFHPELNFVSCRSETPWGTVAVDWRREADLIHVILEVPANCRASLFIKHDTHRHMTVTEERTVLIQDGAVLSSICEGVEGVARTLEGACISTYSGRYSFAITSARSQTLPIEAAETEPGGSRR